MGSLTLRILDRSFDRINRKRARVILEQHRSTASGTTVFLRYRVECRIESHPSRGQLFQITITFNIKTESRCGKCHFFFPTSVIYFIVGCGPDFLRVQPSLFLRYRSTWMFFLCYGKSNALTPIFFYTLFTRVPACMQMFRTVWVSPHGTVTENDGPKLDVELWATLKWGWLSQT